MARKKNKHVGFDAFMNEPEDASPDMANGRRGRATQRSILLRGFWAVLGTFAGLAGTVAGVAGAIAPPHVETVGGPLAAGGTYSVNVHQLFFLLAAALLSLSGFGLWKAGHRGGMGLWRATLRPGIMCAATALMAAGLIFTNCFAAGDAQGAGLALSGIAAAVFFVSWQLRGPRLPLRSGDDYWHRAFAILFSVVALVAAMGTVGAARQWSRQDYHLRFDVPRFEYQTIAQRSYDRHSREWETGSQVVRVPRQTYSMAGVVAGFMALFALGAVGEARFRWKESAAARKAVFAGL